jgi:4-alpha-glucanotransferase
MDLVGKLTKEFPQIQFIAEDLGYLTQEVRQLVADSGLPGMKILEFAFDCREPGNYFPHTYLPNSVCYTGTHDNAPIMAWKEEAAPEDIHTAIQYLGLGEEEGFQWGMLRGGLSCVSDLFLAQMQDYLGLGMDSRTNTPGRLGNNWQWRMERGQITPELIQKMAQAVRLYGRDGGEG